MDALAGLPTGLEDAASTTAARAGLELRRGQDGLVLRVPGGVGIQAAGELLARPRPGARDPLWRATMAGKGSVVDATAGLGGDAFHLAGKGAAVTMVERSAVLAALLADALARAAAGELGPGAREAASRVNLLYGNASDLLKPALGAAVVYLDPMFPSGRQARAAPPKGMAVLRRLFAGGEDALTAEEEATLLAAARRAAGQRVVVKRPRKAEPLGGVQPSGSIEGRTVRYDLYAPL